MVIAEMRSHQGSHGIESCEAARTNGFRDWISDSFPSPSVPALFQHISPQYGILSVDALLNKLPARLLRDS